MSSDENPAVSAGFEFMGPPNMALLYPGAPPQGFQVGGPGVVSGTDQGQAGPHPMQLGLAASNAVEMPQHLPVDQMDRAIVGFGQRMDDLHIR